MKLFILFWYFFLAKSSLYLRRHQKIAIEEMQMILFFYLFISVVFLASLRHSETNIVIKILSVSKKETFLSSCCFTCCFVCLACLLGIFFLQQIKLDQMWSQGELERLGCKNREAFTEKLYSKTVVLLRIFRPNFLF